MIDIVAYMIIIVAFLFSLNRNNDPYSAYINSKNYRKT